MGLSGLLGLLADHLGQLKCHILEEAEFEQHRCGCCLAQESISRTTTEKGLLVTDPQVSLGRDSLGMVIHTCGVAVKSR